MRKLWLEFDLKKKSLYSDLPISPQLIFVTQTDCVFYKVGTEAGETLGSVSQPLWDRSPANSFFIRRGPGPNKFTRKNTFPFFLSSYIKLP